MSPHSLCQNWRRSRHPVGEPAAARPILYSFRRCPYAIRARLALAAAGLAVELRELALACKPPELLEASAKATVPVLVLGAGDPGLAPDSPTRTLDESLAIMRWALDRHDPDDWLRAGDDAAAAEIEALLAACDGPFKHHLDRFKYASRYVEPDCEAETKPNTKSKTKPETKVKTKATIEADTEMHRQAALVLLREWNARLIMAAPAGAADGWLLGSRPSLADWALLPFVRQFQLADPAGFAAETDLTPLQTWLARFLAGPELAAVLAPPWAEPTPWRSPRWLYHLALPEEWAEAQSQGEYRRSSRGLSLEQVGFIHASYAHQLAFTHRLYYADLPRVLLLTIAPQRLAAAGVVVQAEPAAGGQELFPHLYGALPLAAVVAVENWRPAGVPQAVAA